MRLRFWRAAMHLSWAINDLSDEFVEWVQQQYSNEVHGIGSVE